MDKSSASPKLSEYENKNFMENKNLSILIQHKTKNLSPKFCEISPKSM